MNILIVSSYLPFPLFDGGSIRLYNLIKVLSKHHKITLISEIRSHQTEADIREVKKFCEDVFVISHRKPWSPGNIIKSGFSPFPLLLVMHTFREMKQKIVDILNEKRFDVIHVETFYVFQNLPKTYLPIVLVEHNIEYLVYARFAKTAYAFLKPFLYLDIMKIKYWEEKYWKKAAEICSVTEEEKRSMPARTIVVPNGVDVSVYAPTKMKTNRKMKKVLFIGSFKWIQNIVSARWIITEIWPKILETIEKKNLDIIPLLWIVGKNIPGELLAYKTDSIVFDENAPNETWKIYKETDIQLAPIKVGGGSSYKILESMASGVPVVTTSLAASALGAKKDSELLVADDAQGLADHVVKLLQNQACYEKIRKNARVLVEQRYNWEKIAMTLEGVYDKAVKENL